MGYCIISATTDGSGAAVATSSDNYTSGISGVLMGVGIEVASGAPGTTRVKVEELDGLKRTLLNVLVGATSQVYYPTIYQQSVSGDAISSAVAPFVLDGANLKVTISSGGATKTHIVTLMLL